MRLEGWERAPWLLPILRDAPLRSAPQSLAGNELNRFKHLPHPEERREAARLEGWAKVELAGTMDNEEGAHVYMLRCSDGSYYVGSARRGLERRLSEHNTGTYGGYTSKRLPVVLVWSEHFLNITDAIAVERQVKGWSRAKKEALIRGDFGALRALAKRGSK